MSKYSKLYSYLKKEIITNQIAYGGKLPSVRKASDLFGVSRTTVQNAYFDLAADGFIMSEPKSGYYVSYKPVKSKTKTNSEKTENNIKYDFTSDSADKESFDFNLWRRYIKSALRQDERLLSYSESQGEIELREALSDYIRENRNVNASSDRIVVGAGVQSLLGVLCSLIDDKDNVSFPDKSFIQGISLFKDYGFNITYRNKNAKIIYVSPSHMTRFGDVMPNKRRIELVKYSAQNKSLVIEDDYESDFLYNSRPTPSLHALTGGNNVVYIGSFSKLLLPSIRISFMVLTEELAEKYKNNKFKYNQTASKTEQIALCQFIRDGHLKSQIRKTRRFYTTKTKQFAELLSTEFKDAKIEISENALQIKMITPFTKDTNIFKDNGLSVFIDKYENNILKLVLNTSSIETKEFENAIKLLKKAIF